MRDRALSPLRSNRAADRRLAPDGLRSLAQGGHARLDTGSETTRRKKQATRLLKCKCETCGYMVRTARKWLEEAGAPVCPAEGHGAMRHDPFDLDEDAGRDQNYDTLRLSC